MGVNKNNVKIHVEHLKKNFGKLEVIKRCRRRVAAPKGISQPKGLASWQNRG